jgi:hypothetical protein
MYLRLGCMAERFMAVRALRLTAAKIMKRKAKPNFLWQKSTLSLFSLFFAR